MIIVCLFISRGFYNEFFQIASFYTGVVINAIAGAPQNFAHMRTGADANIILNITK
ncbi:hypothetical protein HDR61_02310 [bacterium]|nr:hypothetical protein [bacterium]